MKDGHRKWWVLVVTATALFMALIDETVVGVAVPSFQDDLGMSENDAYWVVSIYLLVPASLVALGGKLADFIGAGRNFLIGMTIFALASVLAGLAPTGEVLIAARALQGLGAAIVLPMGIALVALSFPPRLVGFAMGLMAACAAIALTLGPLVGGALIELLSWRWIFLVNPFIAVPTIVIILLVWREPERSRPGSVDVAGAATLTVGLAGIVLGVMQSDAWGWDSSLVVGSIAVGIASLVAFTLIELRRGEPLIDLRLLRRPTVASGNLIIFTGQFTKVAQIIFLAVFFQEVLGMSALTAGVALIPAGILGFAASIYLGRLIDRVGARGPGLVSLAATAASMAWIAGAAVLESYLLMLPALLLVGIAVQVLFAAPMTAVTVAMPPEAQGQGSGIMITSQMVGGTAAIAIFSTLLGFGVSYAGVFLAGGAVAALVLVMVLPYFDRTVGGRAHTPAPV